MRPSGPERPVGDRKHLESRLAALLASPSDRLVLFDAEDDVGYADAVDILGALRRAGGSGQHRVAVVVYGVLEDASSFLLPPSAVPG